MTDVTSRLRLVVDSSGVDKAGNKLRDVRAEARALDAQAKAMTGAFRGLAAVIGTAFSVQAIVKYADSWKRAENQIKTVSKSLMDVKAAQEGVFAVAQRTYSAHDATAALYTKLTRAGTGLINSQKEALRLVETVNKALAVGGASASERSSVILQLGQAVGSGRLQGDEFRSISENAPLLLDALAKSTGKARGQLKELGAEGKLTAEILIKALKDYGAEVDSVFGKFAPNIEDNLTKLENAFARFVGTNGAPLFDGLAKGIGLVADNLDAVAKAAVAAGLAIGAVFVGRTMSQAVSMAVKSFATLQTTLALNNAQLVALEMRAGLAAGALGRVSIASAAGAGAMRLLNGAMAFFGGPIGLAITAVTLAIGGLAMSAAAAGRDMEALKAAGISAGQVIDKYNDLLTPASTETLSLGSNAADASVKMSHFAGKTGEAAKSLYDYADAQKAAALADVEREQFGLMAAISKNKQRLKAGRRDDDIEVQKALTFGEKSRFKSPSEVAQAAGNVFAGGFENWWTGGESDRNRAAEIDKDVARLKELEAVGNRIGKTGVNDPAWLKGWSNASEAVKKTEGHLGRLFTGLDDSKKKMDDFRNSLEHGLVNPLEGLGKVAKSVSDKTIAALNAISAQKRLFASLKLGGIEAYRDQLAAEDAMNEAKEAGIILDQKGLDLEVQRAREARNRRADTEALYGANLAAEDALNRLFEDLPTKGLAAFKALADDLSDIFRQVWVDAMKSALDPFISSLKTELGKAFGDVFSKTKSFFSDALKKISPELSGQVSKLFSMGAQAYAGYQVGSSAANALGLGGKSGAQQQNAQIGAAVFSAVGMYLGGPVGAAIGSFIGTTIGGLLGPSSTNAAASSLLDTTGKSTSGLLGDKRSAETSQAVNDFITVLQSGYSSLKDLGGVMSVFVKNIEIGQRDPSKIDLSNGQQVRTAVGDTAAAQNAALIEVLRGTTFAVDALNKIKDGMIAAGASFQTTYDALTQVNALLKANEPELSQWAQALKKIDDLFKPLIESTGAYTDALKDAYATAKGALATSFDKEIKNSIKGLLNSPTDQLNDLLETQAKRLEDAKAVGGNLAQVERLTALELQGFFKGLSEDALKEVQSFLGLFDEATNSVVRNLDLSRQDLRSRADAFGAFAESFASLGSDLTERFLAASPRESIGVLRGRVQDLLGGVANGNESAAQALPQAVNKLVDAARQTFGNTSGFNEILAYAQSALGQAKDSALKVQSDAERQIAALDANNDILSDIRDILASSQATSAFFQSYVSGGVASSDALLSLIQKGAGLNLAANDNASALSITGLIAQSVQPMVAPLSASIDAFTARLADMPALQRLTVEAIDRGSDRIVNALATVSDRLDRLEVNGRKQLAELERVNKVA